MYQPWLREVREQLLWAQATGCVGIAFGDRGEPQRPLEVPIRDVEAAGATPGALPPEGSPPQSDAQLVSLRALAEEAGSCLRCELGNTRTRSVFSRGSSSARLAFVGEGPGYHEDQQGKPFVGLAGKLLDRMVAAMGLSEDSVYICNVVKCRPPNNRTPLPQEAGACKPFLDRQLALVGPRCIVALGRCAAEHLGCLDGGDRGWRGRWTQYAGIPVLATYHPAFLLRNPAMKRPVWEDLQAVMKYLAEEPARA